MKQKKIGLLFSILIKTLIIVFCVLGVASTATGEGYMAQKLFLYFTVQSNIWIAVISLIFLIIDIIKLKKPNLQIPNILYLIKFMFTVAITLTFLVFSVMLTPTLIVQGTGWYLRTLENICLHNIVPILAIIDFCLYDYKFVTKKSTFVWGITMPLYYLCFALISSFSGADFGDGAKVPYFFLDYQANGWFNLGNGKFGVIYWLIVILILVIVISLVLVWIKNKINKKVQSKK